MLAQQIDICAGVQYLAPMCTVAHARHAMFVPAVPAVLPGRYERAHMQRAPAVSPSPAESVASSEASETQSVVSDDNNSTSTLSNISQRTTKKPTSQSSVGKDSEPRERPPWRPVSLATPSKADKNAMLKAKILDATRRAMLLQKIANSATQTDVVHTVMMRDFGVDAQPQTPMCDRNVGTDGSTLVVAQGRGLIFTQTVGQMTDDVRCENASTQTAMPRIRLDFDQLYRNYDADCDLTQLDIDTPLAAESTWAVWDNLSDTTMDNKPSLFSRNGCNVNNDIQNRLSGMYLYPVTRPPCSRYRSQPQSQPPSSNQLVDQLIHEANAMLSTFQRFTLALGPANLRSSQCALDTLRPVSPMKPSKWDSILEEACDKLAEQLDQL